MARVTVEDCIDKVDNRFDLVLMASHRARAISSGSPIHVGARQRQEPGRRAARDRRLKAPAARSKEDLIHALQKQVEVDEPEAESAPPLVPANVVVDADSDVAVRSHDGRGSAARPRRHGASAGARRRGRVIARHF